MSTQNNSNVYRYPRYYALGYRWNTEAEADFMTACLNAYGPSGARRLLDIGCGAGRHLFQLAQQGYEMTGVDLQPEMVAFIHHKAKAVNLPVAAEVGDLHTLTIQGTFDGAFCFMDTFRFLLTTEAILAHLRRVGELLVPGGLYLTDFWVPTQWDQIASEVHQWEQTEGQMTVRVVYVQHQESIDPAGQTFEDELIFTVHEGGQVQEIRGGRTRTRLILPEEFRLFVAHAGVFELLGTFSEFDLGKPMADFPSSWRMVSVLRKR